MKEQNKFVVQRHQKESELTHWDLMLESGGVLKTYRLASPPEKWGKEPMDAVKIFDHPLKFLTYEGSVNSGKGRVEIADCGTYRVLEKDDKQQQVSFSGKALKGEFRLRLIKEDTWELSCV